MTDYVISETQSSVGVTDQAVEQPQSTKGQGYINANYYGNLEAQSQQQNKAELDDQALIDALSQKLGIQQQQPPTEPQQQQQDDFSQKLGTEEGQKLVADFKKITGVDLQEAFGVVQNTAKLTQELDAWRQQVLVERQAQQLRQEWGTDYDVIMPKVAEAFKKLPPQMQQALDNPDGARLLAAQIRQMERGALTNRTNPTYVPSGNVRGLSGGNTTPVIRMSEMVNWSGQELDRRMPDVIRAKQAGTLINDL